MNSAEARRAKKSSSSKHTLSDGLAPMISRWNPAFAVLYVIYRFSSSMRYRIPRRFTSAGLAVLAGLVGASLTSLDTENTVSYQAFALLLVLLLVSLPFGFFFGGRFLAVRSLPPLATAGTPMTYRIRIRNLTPKPQVGLKIMENFRGKPPSFRKWIELQRAAERYFKSFRFNRHARVMPPRVAVARDASVPPIPAGGEVEASVELTPLRRGVLEFAGLTLARPDPLGLVQAFSRLSIPERLVILPRRYSLPALTLPGRTKYQQGGVTFASDVGHSEEFVALRDYRRGDPQRHIHWRSWAKTGKPIVKEFEDEFFVRHGLVLDTFSAWAESELFEEAVSVAASFACAVLTQESLLDLLFVGPRAFHFTAGRGLSHTDHILEILASVNPCTDQPFCTLSSLVLNNAALLSGCLCVFLDWNEERRRFVEKLISAGVPLRIVVLVPRGTRDSFQPGISGLDPENFNVLELGSIREGLARLK